MPTNIHPPAYLLLSLALIVVIHFLFPGPTLLARPWTLVGLLPLALGVWLNLRADRALKRHKTTVKPLEETTALITEGVYRISRNPMYLGFVLILLGIALLLGSTTPYLVVAMLAILLDRAFVLKEERKLAQSFGTTWAAYCGQVRRWL